MQTMEQALKELVLNGRVAPEVAAEYLDPKDATATVTSTSTPSSGTSLLLGGARPESRRS
jgi:hypothetical protein